MTFVLVDMSFFKSMREREYSPKQTEKSTN